MASFFTDVSNNSPKLTPVDVTAALLDDLTPNNYESIIRREIWQNIAPQFISRLRTKYTVNNMNMKMVPKKT